MDKEWISGSDGTNLKFKRETELPVFYWIIDDTKAVFSIPSFTGFNIEQGFLTSDANLIKALKDTNITYV